MKYTLYSYRYAQEILEHANNQEALDEIIAAVANAPLFTHEGKSPKNARLDVVQQVMNTWYDRVLAVEYGWDYHPLATSIPDSGLAADFRKCFTNIRVQAEVQFGNMSRWYSDVFKFQTAYAQDLIDVGLCIVPMGSLARRIDSNVVSFERVLRELPSAKMSLTLPILVVGVEPDDATLTVDLKALGIPLDRLTKAAPKASKEKTPRKAPAKLTAAGRSEHNRYRIVNAIRIGADPLTITDQSPTGAMAKPLALAAPIDDGDPDA